MNTIAIVAYRNPIEEWIWESGAMYYFLGALLLLAVVMTLVSWYSSWQARRRLRRVKGKD